MNFAFVSCQSVNEGKMNGYRRMIFEDERAADTDRLGFILHLGDFIYEVVKYPEDGQDGMDRGRKLTGAVRYPKGEKVVRSYHVPVDLEDYRTSVDKVFTAGDMRRGQSLVVWAIQIGRAHV